jgi:hypothetical protein
MAYLPLLPLAHAAHWYFMPAYALPIVLLLAWSLRRTTKERRRREREGASEPRDDEPQLDASKGTS